MFSQKNYICLCGLEVYSERSGPRIATPVDLLRSRAKRVEHGNDAIRVAISTSNVRQELEKSGLIKRPSRLERLSRRNCDRLGHSREKPRLSKPARG